MVYILRSLAVDQENKIETRLSKTEKRKRNLVNHTIYYLETHHDEEITLEQLAEMLYVTPTYLSKTFKAATGVGPINYLIQIRLNHAKELLKNDSLSVKEVAKTVGYEDAYHFSKLFKNIMENLLHNFKIKKQGIVGFIASVSLFLLYVDSFNCFVIV